MDTDCKGQFCLCPSTEMEGKESNQNKERERLEIHNDCSISSGAGPMCEYGSKNIYKIVFD